jgi:hypothetical protein
MDAVPSDVLIAWGKPVQRKLSKLAAIISPFKKSSERKSLEWTPLAMHIIELAPDRQSALNALESVCTHILGADHLLIYWKVVVYSFSR